MTDYFTCKKKEKISALKNDIDSKDLESLKANLTEKKLACYRDAQGKSSLHTAIEKGYFEIALYLLEKCPLLSKLNDCVSLFNLFMITLTSIFGLNLFFCLYRTKSIQQII